MDKFAFLSIGKKLSEFRSINNENGKFGDSISMITALFLTPLSNLDALGYSFKMHYWTNHEQYQFFLLCRKCGYLVAELYFDVIYQEIYTFYGYGSNQKIKINEGRNQIFLFFEIIFWINSSKNAKLCWNQYKFRK